MSVLIDARPHSAAVKTAIKAALASDHAYSFGEAPGDKNAPTEALRKASVPNIYVLVSVERRYNPLLRLSAQAGSVGWRVSARCAGRTVAECQWAMFKVGQALNEARLTIDGEPTTPIQFEADQAPEWDDGRFSGLATYTYVH